MNEGAKNFIKGLTLLCEEWTIAYRSFISQGLSHDEAMLHTKEFMSVIMAEGRRSKEEQQ